MSHIGFEILGDGYNILGGQALREIIARKADGMMLFHPRFQFRRNVEPVDELVEIEGGCLFARLLCGCLRHFCARDKTSIAGRVRAGRLWAPRARRNRRGQVDCAARFAGCAKISHARNRAEALKQNFIFINHHSEVYLGTRPLETIPRGCVSAMYAHEFGGCVARTVRLLFDGRPVLRGAACRRQIHESRWLTRTLEMPCGTRSLEIFDAGQRSRFLFDHGQAGES